MFKRSEETRWLQRMAGGRSQSKQTRHPRGRTNNRGRHVVPPQLEVGRLVVGADQKQGGRAASDAHGIKRLL
jgi:hypothetical protein